MDETGKLPCFGNFLSSNYACIRACVQAIDCLLLPFRGMTKADLPAFLVSDDPIIRATASCLLYNNTRDSLRRKVGELVNACVYK